MDLFLTENLKTVIKSTLYNIPAYQRLDTEKKAKFTVILEEEIEKCSGKLAMIKLLGLPKRMEKRMRKEGLISEDQESAMFPDLMPTVPIEDSEKENGENLT